MRKPSIAYLLCSPKAELTPREREILRHLAEGKADKEIGATLGISISTVQTHIKNIRRKLGIRHRGWARLLEAKQEEGEGNEITRNTQNGD